jgi:hypothetical protein
LDGRDAKLVKVATAGRTALFSGGYTNTAMDPNQMATYLGALQDLKYSNYTATGWTPGPDATATSAPDELRPHGGAPT